MSMDFGEQPIATHYYMQNQHYSSNKQDLANISFGNNSQTAAAMYTQQSILKQLSPSSKPYEKMREPPKEGCCCSVF